MNSDVTPLCYTHTYYEHFLGDNAFHITVQIVSPVTIVALSILVTITYTGRTKEAQTVQLEGKTYDHILYTLVVAPHHTRLLEGDATASLLITNTSNISISIKRKPGVFSGAKDTVMIDLPGFAFEKEVNQQLLSSIEQSRSRLAQARQYVEGKILAHIQSLPR